MASPDSGDSDAVRSLHVDDPTSREMAFERPGRFLFYLRPGRVGNRGQLAVQVIHGRSPPSGIRCRGNHRSVAAVLTFLATSALISKPSKWSKPSGPGVAPHRDCPEMSWTAQRRDFR